MFVFVERGFLFRDLDPGESLVFRDVMRSVSLCFKVTLSAVLATKTGLEVGRAVSVGSQVLVIVGNIILLLEGDDGEGVSCLKGDFWSPVGRFLTRLCLCCCWSCSRWCLWSVSCCSLALYDSSGRN